MTSRAEVLSEVLFIGGCAGVGKTSVAAELHAQLAAARVRHALIEGDNLDLAWPAPWERGPGLAEANLAVMWGAYRSAGYPRLIYTNTASVRAEALEGLLAALGGDPVVHAVLLTAADATVAARLARREIGGALDRHVARGRRAARELEEAAPGWVRRVGTDGRSVVEIAGELRTALGWSVLDEDA